MLKKGICFVASSVLLTLLISLNVHAQEVIDVTRNEKIQSDDNASAQSALMNQAVENASIENIKMLIGEDKTERSRETIHNKIIKNSGRYVYSTAGQNLKREGNMFSMDVQLKISLKALREMLLENGLLYQTEGPPKVLPLVEIVDRMTAQSYGWWFNGGAKEHGNLGEEIDVFHQALKNELFKIGFFEQSPVMGHFIQSLPEPYRLENLQRADSLFLGEFFKSSVVVRGQIIFRPKPNSDSVFLVDVHLEALHSANGRLMAEVVRTYETQPGNYQKVLWQKFHEVCPHIAEDLSAQLTEAWKKGTFGASIVRLTVVGPMAPKDLEDFKKAIVLQIRDIKSLRERLIESHRTTYEADSSALPQQLAQTLRAAKFARFKVQVEDVSNEGVTLKVETL